MSEINIFDIKVKVNNAREANLVYVIINLIETNLDNNLLDIQHYINCLYWLDMLTAAEVK